MRIERGEVPAKPPLWIEIAVMDEGHDPRRIQAWEYEINSESSIIPRLSVMLSPLPETVKIEIVKEGDDGE